MQTPPASEDQSSSLPACIPWWSAPARDTPPWERDSTWDIRFSKQEEARQGLEYLPLPLYLCFTLPQHKVPYKLQKHHAEELSSFSSPTSQLLFSTELLNLI